MSAPARERTAPLKVVEATTVHLKHHGGSDTWSWDLRNEEGLVVAAGPNLIVTVELLCQTLCAVFDLIATPEHYAARVRNRKLKHMESAGRTRWIDIVFEEY